MMHGFIRRLSVFPKRWVWAAFLLGAVLLSGIVAVLPLLASPSNLIQYDEGKWQLAMAKWNAYSSEFLEEFKAKHEKWQLQLNRSSDRPIVEPEPPLEWYEIRSRWFKDMQPEHRVFTIPYDGPSAWTAVHAISVDGTITNLEDIGSRSSKMNEDGSPVSPTRMTHEALNEFLRSLKIRINDTESAERMIKTVIALMRSSSSLRSALDSNRSHAQVCDLDLEQVYFHANWILEAAKEDNDWVVREHYVGPPASIPVPKKWRLHLDADGFVFEVSHGGRYGEERQLQPTRAR